MKTANDLFTGNITTALLCVLLSSLALPVLAEQAGDQKKAAEPAAAPAATPQAPVAAPKPQPKPQPQASKADPKTKVPTCGERIQQVSGFLINGSTKSTAYLFQPSSEVEKRMSSFSLAVENRDAPESYASASFAPAPATGCGSAYDSVTYWPKSCDSLAASNYANLKDAGKLGQNMRVLIAGNNAMVFMMSAGTGCVAIKKELVL